MKALLDHVPQHERLVVIEQPAELKVSHPNAVRWEAVEAIPGQVAITPSQLLAAALRHRPDRIIMGEIRDECGYDLLQAMNTGHGGTLSTIHAKSAWDALNRLSDLALSARANLNHAFMRSETAEAIDFVLYCERDAHGPPPGARADYRERIHPRGPELPDGGHLSCFRRLSPGIQLENRTRIEVTSMYRHAAKSAAQPNSSLKAPSVAIPSIAESATEGARAVLLWSLCAREMGCGLGEHSTAEIERLTSVHRGAFRLVSRPLLGVTLRGQTGALRLGVVLLRLRRPCGVSVPPKRSLRTAAKNTAQTSFGPRQESTPWHLGAGPTRWLCQV